MQLKYKALLWTAVIMIGLVLLFLGLISFAFVRTTVFYLIILIALWMIGSSIYDLLREYLEVKGWKK